MVQCDQAPPFKLKVLISKVPCPSELKDTIGILILVLFGSVITNNNVLLLFRSVFVTLRQYDVIEKLFEIY